MAKNQSDLFRKISFLIPEDKFEDLAVLTASQPGAPSPGPYMRELSLKEAEKGRKLRERLVSKKG